MQRTPSSIEEANERKQKAIASLLERLPADKIEKDRYVRNLLRMNVSTLEWLAGGLSRERAKIKARLDQQESSFETAARNGFHSLLEEGGINALKWVLDTGLQGERSR